MLWRGVVVVGVSVGQSGSKVAKQNKAAWGSKWWWVQMMAEWSMGDVEWWWVQNGVVGGCRWSVGCKGS